MQTEDGRKMTLGGMGVHDTRVRLRSVRVPRVACDGGVGPCARFAMARLSAVL